jgi:hypothetical protein
MRAGVPPERVVTVGRRLVGVALLALAAACGGDATTMVLTPARPSASSTMEITAPGSGNHGYTLHHIDVTAFVNGGTLEIEVTVPPESATDASFDVFQPGTTPPAEGYSISTLAKAYDLGKGNSAKLTYTFARGEVFPFGGEGNWFSPQGNQGTARYTVTVR